MYHGVFHGEIYASLEFSQIISLYRLSDKY